MPCRSSRTDTVLPTSRNVRDPPFFQAFSEMVNLSSMLSWPSAIRWNATKIVIIFAIDAGFIGASAFLLNSTLPVSKSVIWACFAGDVISAAETGIAAPNSATNKNDLAQNFRIIVKSSSLAKASPVQRPACAAVMQAIYHPIKRHKNVIV